MATPLSVALRNGDTVRVLLEGKVFDVESAYGFEIGRSGGQSNFISPGAEHVLDIELVRRATYKVGDTIPSRLDLLGLPDGAVVRNGLGRTMLIGGGRSVGTLRTGDLARALPLNEATIWGGNPPYTIVYLPE